VQAVGRSRVDYAAVGANYHTSISLRLCTGIQGALSVCGDLKYLTFTFRSGMSLKRWPGFSSADAELTRHVTTCQRRVKDLVDPGNLYI
jgi:hypothetical protein